MATAAPRLWRQPDFLKLWISNAVSQVGSQVSFLALPLVAVITLEASPAQMGLLTAMGSLSPLLFGLPAGVVVDRRTRRPLIVLSDAGRALLLGLIPLAWLAGVLTIEWLYVIAFLTGALSLLAGLAHQAMLPAIVTREQLVDANGKLALTSTAAEVAGPTLASTLVQFLTAPVAIAIDAISYLFSALVLSRIRAPEPRPDAAGRRVPAWREAVAGIRVAFADARLRALIGARVLLNFFNAMLEAVFVLFFIQELGLAVALLGLAFSIGGVGFLVGAIMPGWLTPRIGVGPSIILGIVTLALSDLIVPLMTGAPLLVAGLLVGAQFFFGIGLTLFNVGQSSLRQALVPPGYLGRVGATIGMAADVMTPAGAILGGLLGAAIGTRETILLAALGELLAAPWLWASPVRRVRNLASLQD